MRKFSLTFKVSAVLALFIAASIIIATVGLLKISEINNSLNNLVAVTVKKLVLAKTMDATTNEIKNQEKKFILEESIQGMEEIGKVIDQNIDDFLKDAKSLIQIASADEKIKVQGSIEKFEQWRKLNLEVRKLSLANRNKEAFELSKGESKKTLDEIDQAGTAIVEKAEKDLESEAIRTDAVVENARLLIIAVALISLLAGCSLAFLILRAVNKAIDQVISNLNVGSQQVATAAQQIASTSEELSQSTTEQAASLEQTAASVEEMTSMVAKNSENAGKTSSSAMQSQNTAAKGQTIVKAMIDSIGEINDANNDIMSEVEHSNAQVAEIIQVINEIGNKTKVINDIVFQTKLLSFNASVEAARAGEYGKGFAVVAEEVGNLAQMSGKAAQEISEMLDNSTKKVEGIVQNSGASVQRLIVKGKEKVDAGTRIANECGGVLSEIVKSISSVASSAVEISSASQEQALGISEISKAMAQLDQVTQQNSAASEEAASSADQLSLQAESLKAGVLVLIETIKGTDTDHR